MTSCCLPSRIIRAPSSRIRANLVMMNRNEKNKEVPLEGYEVVKIKKEEEENSDQDYVATKVNTADYHENHDQYRGRNELPENHGLNERQRTKATNSGYEDNNEEENLHHSDEGTSEDKHEMHSDDGVADDDADDKHKDIDDDEEEDSDDGPNLLRGVSKRKHILSKDNRSILERARKKRKKRMCSVVGVEGQYDDASESEQEEKEAAGAEAELEEYMPSVFEFPKTSSNAISGATSSVKNNSATRHFSCAHDAVATEVAAEELRAWPSNNKTAAQLPHNESSNHDPPHRPVLTTQSNDFLQLVATTAAAAAVAAIGVANRDNYHQVSHNATIVAVASAAAAAAIAASEAHTQNRHPFLPRHPVTVLNSSISRQVSPIPESVLGNLALLRPQGFSFLQQQGWNQRQTRPQHERGSQPEMCKRQQKIRHQQQQEEQKGGKQQDEEGVRHRNEETQQQQQKKQKEEQCRLQKKRQCIEQKRRGEKEIVPNCTTDRINDPIKNDFKYEPTITKKSNNIMMKRRDQHRCHTRHPIMSKNISTTENEKVRINNMENYNADSILNMNAKEDVKKEQQGKRRLSRQIKRTQKQQKKEQGHDRDSQQKIISKSSSMASELSSDLLSSLNASRGSNENETNHNNDNLNSFYIMIHELLRPVDDNSYNFSQIEIKEHPSSFLIPYNDANNIALQQKDNPKGKEESNSKKNEEDGYNEKKDCHHRFQEEILIRNMQQFNIVESDIDKKLNPIYEKDVKEVDVLFGRGGKIMNHIGNIHFRQLISSYRYNYCIAPKRNKGQLAKNLCTYIRLCNGRFLQKVEKNNNNDCGENQTDTNDEDVWYECGDIRAFAKCGQALREGTAPIIRQIMSSSKDDESV